MQITNNISGMKKRKLFWKIFGIVTAALIITVVACGVGYVSHVRHSDSYVKFDKSRLNEDR